MDRERPPIGELYNFGKATTECTEKEYATTDEHRLTFNREGTKHAK